jgi:F-type H+-transporting ATPase subunit b
MRFWLVIGIVWTALAVFSSTPLRAGEDLAWWGKDEAKPTDAKPDAKDEHKDDIFAGFLDLAIWTVVVFLVLLFVLGRFAWKPMLEGLDRREQSIHGAMEEAKAAREEATRLREQLQAEINKVNEQVRQMMDKARQDAERAAAEVVAKGKADVQAERDRLHREMDTARDQALQQIWEQAARLATLISAKTIRRQLTDDDHRQMIDESLNELRQHYGNGKA